MNFISTTGPIIDFITNVIFIYLSLKFFTFSYVSHSYLYQSKDKQMTIETWLELLVPFTSKIKYLSLRRDIEERLSHTKNLRKWSSNYFLGLIIIIFATSAPLFYLLIVLILNKSFLWVILASATFSLLPYLKIYEESSIKKKEFDRDLPYFIDFLSLCMGAGQDFNNALKTVVNTMPNSPLKEEFEIVIKNIKIGMSRTQALDTMERRINVSGLKLFIQTLIQGIELGTDLVQTLEGLSTIFQNKKFQKAEETAGKISVQMMIPMMVFVMPSVMIILMGPMAIQYIQTM